MTVHGGHDYFGIVVEERDDLLRRRIVRNLGVTVQIAVPQHRTDLLGDAAHDPTVQHSPPSVAAEIGFDERPSYAGECCRLEGEFEERRKPPQRNGGILSEATGRIAGPG